MEFFIDGAMSSNIVGYASCRTTDDGKQYPILFGEIVACVGSLNKNDFYIDDNRVEHHYVIAFPRKGEGLFYGQDCAHIEDSIKKYGLIHDLGKGNIIFAPYPHSTESGKASNTENLEKKGSFSQAKAAILNEMRRLEKRLLEDVLEKQDARVYIDGEFQEDNEKYHGRAVSICKLFSLPSLKQKLLDAGNLAKDIEKLKDGDNTCSYQWKGHEHYKNNWHTWFLKLRDNPIPDRDRIMSDLIQCTIESDKQPAEVEEMLKGWNRRLLELAFPTCYGLDKKRWRTHIYPIYLTELYCKSRLNNKKAIEHFIYGNK